MRWYTGNNRPLLSFSLGIFCVCSLRSLSPFFFSSLFSLFRLKVQPPQWSKSPWRSHTGPAKVTSATLCMKVLGPILKHQHHLCFSRLPTRHFGVVSMGADQRPQGSAEDSDHMMPSNGSCWSLLCGGLVRIDREELELLPDNITVV